MYHVLNGRKFIINNEEFRIFRVNVVLDDTRIEAYPINDAQNSTARKSFAIADVVGQLVTDQALI